MTLATEPYFLGRWQMVRLIESPTGGPLGEFWGEALFEPAEMAPPPGAESDAAGRVDSMQGVLAAVGVPAEGADPDVGAAVASGPEGGAGAAAREGQDRFGAAASLLRCSESGVLRYQGHDYAAGRVTFWRFDPGGAIEVIYEDGRPFHRFSPGRPEATHLCGADTYDVDYAFGPDCWWSRWRVVGPNKDYWMTTRFTRIAEPEDRGSP